MRINGITGMIKGQNIVVYLPYGTDPSNLTATFTIKGQSLTVSGTPQFSRQTRNNFTNPITYTVTAQDGSTAIYIVTVSIAKFIAYYPSDCTLNNASGDIKGNCTCIKDPITGNIWTTKVVNIDIWTNWCNHTPGTSGYDVNCPVVSNNLDHWNSIAQCGLNDGWHLPRVTNSDNYYLDSYNPGGEFSDLYDTAMSGSSFPGSAYFTGGDLSLWMNNNGFENISDHINYWTANTLLPNLDFQISVFYLDLQNSTYLPTVSEFGPYIDKKGILLVRGGQ